MRIGWVDARNGLSGDMWLGALVAVGASLESIERGVQSLGIGEVRVAYAPVRRGGRRAVTVRVRPPAQTPHVGTVAQVRALVEFAALDEGPRNRALAILDRFAHAEATAAGLPLADLTFHEVAMLDDLAAIVGVAVALQELAVDRFVAGPIGVPTDEEGALDPTVALLLAGHVTRPLDTLDPIVTAVGAAILAEIAEPGEVPELTIEAEGSGAASRDLPDAGLLHLTLGTPSSTDA